MLARPVIQSINVKDATNAEYEALNRHSNRIRLERLPDDPPIPLDESIRGFQNIPGFVEFKLWCIWDSSQSNIVAQGNILLIHAEDNQHMAQFDITVLPEHRRKGMGNQLLAKIVEAAQADHRRLLIAETVDRIPAGEVFLNRLGAKKGLEAHNNQLRIADLDPSIVQNWLEKSQDLSAQFELGFWEGPYSEDQLVAMSNLVELTNQQPLGDIDIEDMHMTPEQLRQADQMLFARGNQRWTFTLVEKATGKFAGYTETVWNPNRPEILRQEMTGVFPEYRGKGLGKWLKAAMLDKALKERPTVKFIRTGNADSNAAMLKINHELGFKPYLANAIWQVETDQVIQYLNR